MENENNANVNSEEELIEDSQNNLNELEPEARDYEGEIASLKDQLLRSMAEAENIRKRAEKQIEDASKYSVSSFAKDLTNVMENLYRAGETIKSEEIAKDPLLKTINEGIEMTKRELINVFEKNGLNRIYPALGDAFDHNLHQAVMQAIDPSKEPNTIIQILQAGYMLKDRLLMPAMVGVSKKE